MTTSNLAWEDPRTVLKRHNLWAKRALSQNFLIARPVVERIAERAHAVDAGLVIELGPGLGTLTKALLDAGSRVVAIERDRDMIAVMQQELAGCAALQVREADAARVDFAALSRELASPLTVVGNLPYAITGAILRNVIDNADHIPAAVFMVQREVRDRLHAEAATAEYGALTVFATSRFDVTTLMHVGRNCFHPAPRVTSSVLLLRRQAVARAPMTPTFQRVVKASFGTRRKTLRNALLNSMIVGAAVIDRALAAALIDGKRRGETLTVEEFRALAEHIDAVSVG